jgi:hypothetical protein
MLNQSIESLRKCGSWKPSVSCQNGTIFSLVSAAQSQRLFNSDDVS